MKGFLWWKSMMKLQVEETWTDRWLMRKFRWRWATDADKANINLGMGKRD